MFIFIIIILLFFVSEHISMCFQQLYIHLIIVMIIFRNYSVTDFWYIHLIFYFIFFNVN